MVAFKKRVDGLLTGAEVRRPRRQLNLSQEEAARVFGGGPVAFSKYEADDVAQSAAMDKLLRLAADVPGAAARLFRQAGIEPALAVAGWQDASDWNAPAEDRKAHIPQARYLPIGIFSRHIATRCHLHSFAVDASGERLKIVRDTSIKIGHTERWRAE